MYILLHILMSTQKLRAGLEGCIGKDNGTCLWVGRVLGMFYFISFDKNLYFCSKQKTVLSYSNHSLSHITCFNSLHSLRTMFFLFLICLLPIFPKFLSFIHTILLAFKDCFNTIGTQ